MTATDPDEDARRLAAESLAVDDATGWFERLYAAAEEGAAIVPWDRGAPHWMLVEWAQGRRWTPDGRRALVVGCGLGFDAEYLADLGFGTVAFDVSTSAVRSARRRFPSTSVHYLTANLLNPPAHWRHAFDLVVEIMTVQSLPEPHHEHAIAQVTQFVAPGGALLVIASGRDERDGRVQGPPWPLTRAEVDAFAAGGLEPVRIEDVRDDQQPTVRRWRAEFRRPEPD